MSFFKSSPLVQIVQELNRRNASTQTVPLSVFQCSLSNFVPWTGLYNTKATLTIVGDNENYPDGTIDVYYNRLVMSDLFPNYQAVNFAGVDTKAATNLEILTKLDADVASVIGPYLGDSATASKTYTRTSEDRFIQAPGDSPMLTGSTHVWVKAGPVDLGLWNNTDLTATFFRQDQPLSYGVDLKQQIVDLVKAANGYASLGLLASNCTITYTDPVNSSRNGKVKIKVNSPTTMSAAEGEKTFDYKLVDPRQMQLDFSTDMWHVVTDASDARAVIRSAFTANSRYEPDLPYLGVLSYRDNAGNGEPDLVQPNINGLGYYWAQDSANAIRLDIKEATPRPWRVRLGFNNFISMPLQVFTEGIAAGPTSLKVISGPTGTLDWPLDMSTGRTASAFPAGSFIVEFTYANSRNLRSASGKSYLSFSPGVSWQMVQAVEGVRLDYMFKDCNNMTGLVTGMFATPQLVESVKGMFQGCISLNNIPADITTGLTRCYCFDNMFSGATTNPAVTNMPEKLFDTLPLLYSRVRTAKNMFTARTLSGLGTALINNANGFSWDSIFAGVKLNAAAAEALWNGTNAPAQYWAMNDFSYTTRRGQIDMANAFNGSDISVGLSVDMFSSFRGTVNMNTTNTFAGVTGTVPPTIYSGIPIVVD